MFLFLAESIVDGVASISGEEAAHALRVLRMKEGDRILVTALDGVMHEATVNSVSRDMFGALVTGSHPGWGARGYSLRVCIAPTKNMDRYEWFLEKATEIGIDRITPVCCDRSERKFLKRERGIRILRSAVKQSMKASVPILDEMTDFPGLMAGGFGDGSQLFIAHCDGNSPRTDIRHEMERNGKYTVLIGPEGDFSEDEISLAIARGFRPVTFGNSRLRTETAGLWAVTLASVLN